MAEYALSFAAGSIICGIALLILPEKNDKGLKKTLKLLSSLILIIMVFAPILKLFDMEIFELKSDSIRENESKIMSFIPKKSLSEIEKRIKTYYPAEDFTLTCEFSDNYEIKKIFVNSDSKNASKIAGSISILYDIETEVKKVA